MKAVVLKDAGNLVFSEIKPPRCKAGEVLIKVDACSICSTDVKAVYQGQRDLKMPRILGHEVAGTIAEKGRNVHGFKLGQRVQIAPGVYCGVCPYCLKGMENMCDNIRIIGFHLDGGFAEYLLVPTEGVKAGILNPIPQDLSFTEASLAEPIACCINALSLGKLTEGETIAIFGAGPIGCLLVQLSRARGASKIILIEKDKKRLKFARRFGADCHVHDSDGEAFSTIEELTNGEGVDVLIAACPAKEIPACGINLLRKRGRILFFSGIPDEEVSVNYSLIHYKELQVIGAYGCTTGQNKEALSLMARFEVNVKELITHCFALEEIEKALAIVKNREGMKVVINKF